VVVIPGYFMMVTKFADYQGAFVMHCHILAHEDRGMMMSVQVGTSNPAQLFTHY
jgi:FtsP/CotA-like multicopper oxidase with cupredoxin domain